MNNLEIDLTSEWLLFLKTFFGDPISSQHLIKGSSNSSFYVGNVLDSRIDMDGRWGFLNLIFKAESDKETFLKLAEIERESVSKVVGNWKLINNSAIYSQEKYPCRIFPASGKLVISLYDLENVASNQEILKNRIEVFEINLETIIKVRVLEISSSYFRQL